MTWMMSGPHTPAVGPMLLLQNRIVRVETQLVGLFGQCDQHLHHGVDLVARGLTPKAETDRAEGDCFRNSHFGENRTDPDASRMARGTG